MCVRNLSVYTCSIVLLALALPTLAQLTPPAGPVADSFKNLDEVEPRIPINATNTPGDTFTEYIITQPGSYYLTQDTVVPSKRFLFIDTTGDVTVDLNGFSAEQVLRSNHNIQIASSVDSVTIRNGTLRGGFHGISTDGGVALPAKASLVVENIVVNNPMFNGINSNRVTTIRDTMVRNTGSSGIVLINATSNGSVIERTHVMSTGSTGIQITNDSRITDVTVTDVAPVAVFTGTAANIRGLTVTNYGIAGSTSAGVTIGRNSIVTQSTFNNYVGTGRAVVLSRDTVGSAISLNGAPSGTGIFLDTSTTLLDSFVDNTFVFAVQAGSFTTIKRNSIERSSGSAISLISSNVLDDNRFFGDVLITGSNNVVTRNVLVFGSFINTGGVSNTIGPINDLTSPWANFDK